MKIGTHLYSLEKKKWNEISKIIKMKLTNVMNIYMLVVNKKINAVL